MGDLPRNDVARIDEALTALPGWEREGQQLIRRVPVAAHDQDNLERAVMKVADELDHHPVIERSPDALCFRLWTHSVGRITERDFELAARIDQTEHLSSPTSATASARLGTISGTVQD